MLKSHDSQVNILYTVSRLQESMSSSSGGKIRPWKHANSTKNKRRTVKRRLARELEAASKQSHIGDEEEKKDESSGRGECSNEETRPVPSEKVFET